MDFGAQTDSGGFIGCEKGVVFFAVEKLALG